MHLHRHTTHLRRLLLATLALFTASLLLPGLVAPRLEAANMNMGQIRKGLGAVTNTTKKQVKKKKKGGAAADGTEGPIDDETIPQWFVELTPSYLHVNNTYIDKLRGGNIAFGWRFSPDDSLKLEIGYDTGDYSKPLAYERYFMVPGAGTSVTIGNVPYVYNYVNMTGTAAAKIKMIPLFFSYNYHIALTESRRFELRLTPALGFFGMKSTWSLRDSSGTYVPKANTSLSNPDPGTITAKVRMPDYSGSDSWKLAFSVGAGAGFTYNITSRLYVDIAYRYFWVNHVKNVLKDTGVANLASDGSFTHFDPGTLVVNLKKPNYGPSNTNLPMSTPEVLPNMANGDIVSVGTTVWNGAVAWNNMNVHSYTFTIGWKF